MEDKEKRLKEMMEDKVGTARQELLSAIRNGDDPYNLAQAFAEATPFEKSLGPLYGKLLMAQGYSQVDNAFDWYEAENGEFLDGGKFTWMQKILLIAQTIQQTEGANEKGYRNLRKILVTLNQK